MAISWKHGGKPNALGIVTGGVAGLAAITPASGYVGPPFAAIIIGGVAGIICYFAMHLKNHKTNIDDSLDVFACHGVGSTWGVLATGIFASVAINSAGANGLVFGSSSLLIFPIYRSFSDRYLFICNDCNNIEDTQCNYGRACS